MPGEMGRRRGRGTWVVLLFSLSKRMLYPIVPPMASPRSAAMRSATEMALRRRGCVTTMRHWGPISGSSRRNCGTWVVLPHPVSPLTNTICSCLMSEVTASWCTNAGSPSRFRCIDAYAGLR